MALVIEDGTGKLDSNSYITVAEYNAFLDARYVSRSAISEAQAEAYILRATDYFETLKFQGWKHEELQAMQWPRSNIIIDGFSVNSDEIPIEVKLALYELAYAYEQGYGITDPVSRETISESVGSLSVTYKSSSADRTLTPAATKALTKLTIPTSRVVRV